MGTDIADDRSDPRTQLYLQLSGNTARPHPAQPHPARPTRLRPHGRSWRTPNDARLLPLPHLWLVNSPLCVIQIYE